MRLQPSSVHARVTPGRDRRRPVLFAVGDIVFALTTTEAHDLADQLHDTAEDNR